MFPIIINPCVTFANRGGVRQSVLRDVVLTDVTTQGVNIIEDLPPWGTSSIYQSHSNTLGFTIFAEDLPAVHSGPFPMPCDENGSCLSLKIGIYGCHKAPNHYETFTVSTTVLIYHLFQLLIVDLL